MTIHIKYDETLPDTLRHIVMDVLNAEFSMETITNNSNLIDLGLASIQMVDLLSAIENRFKITVEIEDISPDLFTRFGSLVEFVGSRVAR